MARKGKFGDYDVELEYILNQIGNITKKYEVYVIGAYGNIQGSFDLELSQNIYYKEQEKMEKSIRTKWSRISNIPLNDIFYHDVASSNPSGIPEQPYDILDIFDSGTGTMDRYHVVFRQEYLRTSSPEFYGVLSMSYNPDSPQGYSQFGEGSLRVMKQHYQRISWKKLPKNIREHVIRRLTED